MSDHDLAEILDVIIDNLTEPSIDNHTATVPGRSRPRLSAKRSPDTSNNSTSPPAKDGNSENC